MIGRPTRRGDIDRVASHNWYQKPDDPLTAICRDCELEFTLQFAIRDLPICPGPDYILVRRSRGAHRKE